MLVAKLLKNSIGSQLLLLIVVTLMLWVPSFLVPQPMLPSNSFAPLYDLIYKWLSPFPRITSALSLLIILTSGILLNVMLYNYKIITQNTLIPAFMYVLLMSMNGTALSPIVIINLLVIMAFRNLFLNSSLLSISSDQVYGAAAIISLSTVIYFPSVVLVIAMLAIFIVYNLYNWRDLMMLILGLLSAHILLFTYYYMTEQVAPAYTALWNSMQQINIVVDFSQKDSVAISVVMILLLLISFFHLLDYLTNKIMLIRKNATVIIMLLLSAIGVSCYQGLIPMNVKPYAIPLSYMVSVLLIYGRMKPMVKDIVLLVCMAMSIIAII